MSHVDEGLLHTYLDGELEGAERDQVLAHLGECAACRTRLEEARALVARAGELLARAAPPKRGLPAFPSVKRSRAPGWRIPAAWAATVTIAFVAGWYAQGKRLATELANSAIQVATEAPAPVSQAPATGVAKARRAPRAQTPPAVAPLQRSGERRSETPPAAVAGREEDVRQLAADAAAPAAAGELAVPRDDAAAWPALDADGAHALLGRAPAVLPGVAVRRMARSPAGDGVVLIEQEWKPGVVIRLYESRAVSMGRTDAAPPSSGRARAAPSASASAALREEQQARYVSSLRVEIAGPLAADALARLLDSVE